MSDDFSDDQKKHLEEIERNIARQYAKGDGIADFYNKLKFRKGWKPMPPEPVEPTIEDAQEMLKNPDEPKNERPKFPWE
jgi:hypothetical protein